MAEDDPDALPLEDALDAVRARPASACRAAARRPCSPIAAGSSFFNGSRTSAAQARWSGTLTPLRRPRRRTCRRAPRRGGARPADPVDADRPVSASRLATLLAAAASSTCCSTCCASSPRVEPEERKRLDPLERGSALPRGGRALPARAARPRRAAGARTTTETRARLLELADGALDRLVAGTPAALHASCGSCTGARSDDLLLQWLAREAADARRRRPRALRGRLRHARERAPGRAAPPRAAADRPRRRPRCCGSPGKIDRIDGGADGILVLRDYKTGTAPRATRTRSSGARKQLQIPFYVLAARAALPRPAGGRRPSSTTWTAGRPVAFDPAAVRGEAFRCSSCASWWTRSRHGLFVQEPTRLHAGATSRRPAARSRCWSCGASSRSGDPQPAARTAPAGRRDELRRRPTEDATRERARDDLARRAWCWRPAPAPARPRCSSTASRRCVRSGARARSTEIAAVTFTENAATTMKLRLRERLERARADAAAPEAERGARRARPRRPGAGAGLAPSTPSARRSCRSGRSSAACVPGFRTADEAEADAALRRGLGGVAGRAPGRGRRRPAEALDARDPARGRRGLRRAHVAARPRPHAPRAARPRAARRPRTRPTRAPWRASCSSRRRARARCAEAAADGDALAGRALERSRPSRSRAGSWRATRSSSACSACPRAAQGPAAPARDWRAGRGARGRARPSSAGVAGRRDALEGRPRRRTCTAGAGRRLRRRAARATRRRRRERGVLDFLDLLVKARDALRDRESVRRYFRGALPLPDHRRVPGHGPAAGRDRASSWRASAPGAWWWWATPSSRSTASAARTWRSSARLAAEARGAAGPRGAAPAPRTSARGPAILRFVNRAFATLITGVGGRRPARLRADRPAARAARGALRSSRCASQAERLRRAVPTLLRGRGRRAGRAHRAGRGGRLRGARPGDRRAAGRAARATSWCWPARLTQVRYLEDALDARGRCASRWTAASRSSTARRCTRRWPSLRAIDDPADRVSPGGRAALVVLRRERPRHRAPTHLAGGAARDRPGGRGEAGAPRALGARAARSSSDLHDERLRATPCRRCSSGSTTETRVLAALTGTRRGEAQIANLEKVAALARQAGASWASSPCAASRASWRRA